MGANKFIGVEMNDYRIDLVKKPGLADLVVNPVKMPWIKFWLQQAGTGNLC